MKSPELSYNPKINSLLIVSICLIGMLIGNYVQRFRYSEYSWIYQYGSLLNLIMTLGSMFWSLFHPLIVWFAKKGELKKEIIWILIGMIPILYFSIMMSLN